MNILSFFTKAGSPAIGLNIPTIKIIEVPSGAVPVNGQDMTEISNGFYFYDFVGYDFTKDYAILCDGTNELSGSERYVVAGNENYSVELIRSEINEIIRTDPSVELAAIPNDTAPLADQIQFLFQYFRNKKTVTNTKETIFKENAVTELGSSILDDDGTTFTKNEMA
jgi:hypothetical protein